MAWKCEIVGHMIGDAQPERMTFWVGVAGSYKTNRLPENVPVRPERAYVKVQRSDGRGPSIRADFELPDLVRCGTGAHKNLAYQGWKATVEGLEPETEYTYGIFAFGTAPGEEFGITEDFHVSNIPFRTPSSCPAPFKAVFSSCQRAKRQGNAHVDSTQPAWAMVPSDVSVNLLLGDTHYADSHTRWKKWDYSTLQFRVATYQKVIASVPTYAIYDDHDFIDNNQGGDTSVGRANTTYGPKRERASRYFDGLWIIPETPGRGRSQGCYHSFYYQGVLFVMLDTLFHRKSAPNGNILGDAQWSWLATVLATATKNTIKVVCSGCTLTDSTSEWEWKAYPAAEAMLRQVLEASPGGLGNTLFVSGDVHRVEYVAVDEAAGVPIPELISSGIGLDKSEATRGFAVVEFDPVKVAARYSLYNWNSDHEGPYDGGDVVWSAV